MVMEGTVLKEVMDIYWGAGGNSGPGTPAKVIYNDSSRGSHSGNDNGNGNGVHTNTRTKGR